MYIYILHICKRTNKEVHINMYTYTYIYIETHIYTYIARYVYVCMYIYISIYICMSIYLDGELNRMRLAARNGQADPPCQPFVLKAAQRIFSATRQPAPFSALTLSLDFPSLCSLWMCLPSAPVRFCPTVEPVALTCLCICLRSV